MNGMLSVTHITHFPSYSTTTWLRPCFFKFVIKWLPKLPLWHSPSVLSLCISLFWFDVKQGGTYICSVKYIVLKLTGESIYFIIDINDEQYEHGRQSVTRCRRSCDASPAQWRNVNTQHADRVQLYKLEICRREVLMLCWCCVDLGTHRHKWAHVRVVRPPTQDFYRWRYCSVTQT